MPQWRKIHTKSVESLDIHEMPDDFHRLLWLMLPLVLDRCGRGMDSAAWVRSKAMPMREDVSNEMAAAALDWYAEHGMIERYEVDGRRYFWIPTWHNYQGDTGREADSQYPAPPGYLDPYVKDNGADEGENEGESPNDYTQEQDKGKSKPSPEQVVTNSCSDSDADTDSNADTEAEGADAPPDPPPKRQRKARKPKKPTPAAVKVFRANAHRYPAKAWYEDVAQTVGEVQADLDRWGVVVKAWVGCGYNPTNVKGMLECYREGTIPSTGGKGKKASEPAGYDAIRSYAARHGMEAEA